MINEQTIANKYIFSFSEWKNNIVSSYQDSSNKKHNSSKPHVIDFQNCNGENVVKLFFCRVPKKDQEKLKVVKINGGVGEILLDPKTDKILNINLIVEKLSCHTLDTIETYDGLSPMNLTCVYEKGSDSLMIHLIDENKCRNLTCTLANEEYFGHDIILDIDKNGRICGIEVLDASEYLPSNNNESS